MNRHEKKAFHEGPRRGTFKTKENEEMKNDT